MGTTEYKQALCRAMDALALIPNSIFLGQAVACEGTAMRGTLETVPRHKLLEMPVAEDMQMGMATGMAVGGYLPICVYPRWNFLLLAVSQLVLHLDKMSTYSRGGYRPRVIVRTAIATAEPLDPGSQHVGDYTDCFRMMLQNVKVIRLEDPNEIVGEYMRASEREGSTLMVEDMRRY